MKAFAVDKLVAKELSLLRSTGRYLEPRVFPEVDDFVQSFQQPEWRRPILLILGATNLGKSLLAARIIEQVWRSARF